MSTVFVPFPGLSLSGMRVQPTEAQPVTGISLNLGSNSTPAMFTLSTRNETVFGDQQPKRRIDQVLSQHEPSTNRCLRAENSRNVHKCPA